MTGAWPGYRPAMDLDDLLAVLGERHLDRGELPGELRPLVDEALLRGLVIEDCRDKLVRL